MAMGTATAGALAAAVLALTLASVHAIPPKTSQQKHAAHAASATATVLANGDTGLAGKALAKCDRSTVNDPKFPTTGWRRQDLCTAEDADHGSHFVCVNMPSDFWVNTGQASSAADAKTNWPQPGPWCICMWAYANYLEQSPSFADDVICDATNEWVLDKYDKTVPQQCAALMSLCKKCKLASASCPTDC